MGGRDMAKTAAEDDIGSRNCVYRAATVTYSVLSDGDGRWKWCRSEGTGTGENVKVKKEVEEKKHGAEEME